MKAFPYPLVIRAWAPSACKGKQIYTLEADFAYLSPAFGPITVPAGLRTDFASVPRLVWSYLSPEDPCILYGSIVHDFLYQSGGRVMTIAAMPNTNPLFRRITRAESDEILREAMLACGARRTQAAVVYRALRLFGSSNFKS